MKRVLALVLVMASFGFAKDTPLVEAVKKSDMKEVSKLLKSGVDEKSKKRALNLALKEKKASIAQLIYGDRDNYVFIRADGKAPLYMKLDRRGFRLKDKALDNNVILFGAVSLYTFKKSAEAFDNFIRKNKIKPKNFVVLAMMNKQGEYEEYKKIKSEIMKYTTFLYLNYDFYELLNKTLKFTGTPLFLLRDKTGKITDGWVGWTIFKDSPNFKELIK